jgi:DNA (cytosine-5)-methyltransferase 1
MNPTFLEFFAGSGLVAEALKPRFNPAWANDFCEKKAAVYMANHSSPFELRCIENIHGKDLPPAVLAWASFPCQDLSLAGNMKGIEAERSGLVWQWLRVMDEMSDRPMIVVAENVAGLVSADNGAHYVKLHIALVERGYLVGALMLDAARWLPQSRPRVFVVGAKAGIVSRKFCADGPTWAHSQAITKICVDLPGWIWWKMPEPAPRNTTIEDIVEWDAPAFDPEKISKTLALIPPHHKRKLNSATGIRAFPGYKRTRNGRQCLEIRFDSTAGCLRTPEGGSSRQFIILRDGGELKVRLLTVREAARLMGARDSYKIPGSYNDGYKAMGDAVAVPVARYLSTMLLYPLVRKAMEEKRLGKR